MKFSRRHYSRPIESTVKSSSLCSVRSGSVLRTNWNCPPFGTLFITIWPENVKKICLLVRAVRLLGCLPMGPSTVSYWKNSITVYQYLDWIIILISMIYVGNWCQKCILLFNGNAHVHWIEKDSLWSKLIKKEDIWSMHNFKRNIILLFIYWFNIQKFSIYSWTYYTEFNVYSLFRV